jgi:hypothetical protein
VETPTGARAILDAVIEEKRSGYACAFASAIALIQIGDKPKALEFFEIARQERVTLMPCLNSMITAGYLPAEPELLALAAHLKLRPAFVA